MSNFYFHPETGEMWLLNLDNILNYFVVTIVQQLLLDKCVERQAITQMSVSSLLINNNYRVYEIKMKLTEILSENHDLDEAPMGALKRAGLGLSSKVSSKASGKLASGKEANEIKKDYDFWLGSTNQKSTADSLMQFLQREKYPVDKAKEIIAKMPGDPQTAMPKSTVDDIITTIAQSRVASGQTSSTSKSSQQSQDTSQNAQVSSFKQVQPMIDRLKINDRQELIDYLKRADQFNELKFN